jgi:lysozyme
MDLDKLKQQLTLDEGYRTFPYDDQTGKPPLLKGRLTVGIGHNLTDNGLPDEIVQAIFISDVTNATNDLSQKLPWWTSLDDVRQRVLVDMCFNLGIKELVTFTNLLGFIKSGSYQAAADDMRTTLWYKQVGARGERLARMMESGEDA